MLTALLNVLVSLLCDVNSKFMAILVKVSLVNPAKKRSTSAQTTTLRVETLPISCLLGIRSEDFKLDGCALAISDFSVAPADWFALRGLLTPCSSRIVAPRPWTASTDRGYGNNQQQGYNYYNNQRGGGGRGQEEEKPNHVLLMTILNPAYPITVDVIHTICTPSGKVMRIVIFKKNGVQAMVEYPFFRSQFFFPA
ncbi:hypothetical protein HPB51_007114 [Rhipicephalus microplus]|uniref:Uncharacterized protein n=1 Tax=Rhipicephalus microplus TaxID=6941 RepID=A0A9J6DZU4_RHIMP|nr:hypothetical protein HPB51_007114 [Rhipicephalus microplus]